MMVTLMDKGRGYALLICLLFSSAMAQETGFQDVLLDNLAGDWVLEGTIAGQQTTHDIVAEWVVGHQYLSFHEVSREKGDGGAPAYEAIVFIGWDEPSERYVCMWLDSTGGGGLANNVFGYAEPSHDKLAFVFGPGDTGIFHTTFAYNRDSDTWDWIMDAEEDGERTPFARVSLTRQ